MADDSLFLRQAKAWLKPTLEFGHLVLLWCAGTLSHALSDTLSKQREFSTNTTTTLLKLGRSAGMGWSPYPQQWARFTKMEHAAAGLWTQPRAEVSL
jgi:hypothetical protein